MRVYAVIGYDNYYPEPDNIVGIYLSEQRAEETLEECLREGRRDNYEIVYYIVED